MVSLGMDEGYDLVTQTVLILLLPSLLQVHFIPHLPIVLLKVGQRVYQLFRKTFTAYSL